jgi:two-component system response regulator ChvI
VTVTCCPKCGYDLKALHDLTLGDLTILYDGAIILWKDERVGISPTERLMLMSIARADGAPVKRQILAEVMGYEGDDGDNIVAVHLSRINRRFREIDPGFDQIENIRAAGLRWKVP